MAENTNNQNNNQAQMPFWDFMRAMDTERSRPGFGVDHLQPGHEVPFGPREFDMWAGHGGWGGPWGGPWGGHWGGPWGRGGRWHGRHHHHGRRHRRDGDDSGREGEEHAAENEHSEVEDSPETMRETPEGPDVGAEGMHHPPPPPHPHHGPGPHTFGPPPFGPGSHHFGPGPHRCRSGRGRGGRGPRGGMRGEGRHGGPPPHWNGPFDFRPLLHTFSSHPFAQAMRDYVDQTRAGPSDEQPPTYEQEEESFVPPVDIFNTEKAYILHISLPGAVKEDVGVNWDAEKSLLNIAGVVYRPGNEEFLQSLASSERKVGMFERAVKLPPPGADEKEEVDGFSITAKMENGILIVTVPKAEKEWTEIHKVDVQ